MKLLKSNLRLILFLLCSVQVVLAESREREITERFEKSLRIKKEDVYIAINGQEEEVPPGLTSKSPRKAMINELNYLTEEKQQLQYIWLFAAGLTDSYIQEKLLPQECQTIVLLTVYLHTLYEIEKDESNILKCSPAMEDMGYENISMVALNLLSIETPREFSLVMLKNALQASINFVNDKVIVEVPDEKSEEKKYILAIEEVNRKRNDVHIAGLAIACILGLQLKEGFVRYMSEEYKPALDVVYWAMWIGVAGYALSKLILNSRYEMNLFYRNLFIAKVERIFR